MKLKDYKSQPVTPVPEKKWYEKLQFIVPIIVALISGLFVLIPIYFPAKQAKEAAQSAKEYNLIFIDRQTLKPFVFRAADQKIKVYCESPPLVLPITLGTAKFTSNKIVQGEPTLLELEDQTECRVTDRRQQLREGSNEVFVESISIGGTDSAGHTKRFSENSAEKSRKINSGANFKQITGLVQDENSHALAGVKIICEERPVVVTDSFGRFQLTVTSIEPRVRLKAEKHGFKSWSDDVLTDKKNLLINLASNEK